MKVGDIMTKSPSYCTPKTSLVTAAKMMCDSDCGELPVLENERSMKTVGVVTDRDIACRTVGQGRNPLTLSAADCMSSPAITVTPDTELADCCELLERHQIRRAPVVDGSGRCVGMVSQADIARRCPPETAGELVRELSQAGA